MLRRRAPCGDASASDQTEPDSGTSDTGQGQVLHSHSVHCAKVSAERGVMVRCVAKRRRERVQRFYRDPVSLSFSVLASFGSAFWEETGPLVLERLAVYRMSCG